MVALERFKTFFHTDSFLLFDSGHSLHGYSTGRVLTEEAWIKFMGMLILANKDHLFDPDTCQNMKPVFDTRWVGHSLERGFGALRWSCNADKYVHIPRFRGSLTACINEL